MRECRYFIFFFCIFIHSIDAFNRSLFFRTSSFWDEPRFEKPCLTSFDIQVLGGTNHKGQNGRGQETNILSIYGPEHPAQLVADKNLPKKLSFRGTVDVFEADLNFYQNFTQGFFIQFHLPVLLVRIARSGFSYRNSSQSPPWQIPSLTPLLKQFCLSDHTSKEGGLSDSTLFVGWTHSFDSTCYFDFVDSTIRTGILLPTGKKKNENLIFDIPFGYNGHWAFPFSWDISLGAYEWLTWGFHSDCLFFLKKNQCIRMKTVGEPLSGLITRFKGTAEIKPSIVWRLGTYFKADHIYKGLSLLLAFSYEQSNKATVIPAHLSQFNKEHVNKDPRFQKWARSIFHIGLEYDFISLRRSRGVRVGLFYNHQMTGLRVFKVNTPGGYVGLDVNWCF